VRRWLKRVGIGLVVLLTAALGLAWYVKSLPWRNTCADPAPALAAKGPRTNSAVATSQPLATEAARDVLREGGNAADAAIAAALMLAVAEPGNSGLGGGGFALIHDPKTGRDLSLDFRERAPLGLRVDELTAAWRKDSNALRNGALAVAVPAEWSGVRELHRRFGSLPLSRLARPAIRAARSGIVVGRDYSARCWVRTTALRADPEAKRTFLTSAGLCPLPGWTLRQPELANTLEALTRDHDPADWDELVGQKMVAFLSAKGSRIAAADLAAAKTVERAVVEGRFHGKRIVSMGPPSSGGILVIGLLQTYEQLRKRQPKANRLLSWTEASRLAFYDRATLLGDPDFVAIPVDRLISDSYATTQAARVPATGRTGLPKDVAPREGSHTTHLSVVDKNGLAIALTQTINVPFGSGLVVPGTGVLLNDEMDDFYVEGPNAFGLVGNERNAPAPGKHPLSSMSPTFVFDDQQLLMVIGSPGGSSIPSAVAWVIREVIENRKTGDVAMRSPRLHHQWFPDVLQVEPRFERSELPAELAEHTEKPMFPVGRIQMVLLEPNGWRGVSDCRDEGAGWAGAL
jgi:gamma-glutamyltranspeptidase/glutathione hydrolase